MANIELVIKIPEELKEALDTAKKENAFNYMRVYNDTLYDALKNGISLPKGHGKIGDIDRLYEVFKRNVVGAIVYKQLFVDAPTIIEADKVESEGDT